MFLSYLDKTVEEAVKEILSLDKKDDDTKAEKINTILSNLVRKNLLKYETDLSNYGGNVRDE